MWDSTWSELLAEETESIVVTSIDMFGLREILLEALGRGQKDLTLSDNGSRYRSSLLPLKICYAVRGECKTALPAGAAYHFLLVAADVFDDIEDADSSNSLPAKYGTAIAVNAATTLLILAEKAVTRLEARAVPDRTIVRVMDALNSYYAVACAGQHMDLSLTTRAFCSEDEYFRIANMKSGSQSECACHIGALVANADRELVEKFSAFGYHLGMASQIANDIQGVIEGNDILKPRLTLPFIYALSHADRTLREVLENAFIRRRDSKIDPSLVKDALFRCGAVHYAAVQTEIHKQEAKDILADLYKRGVNTEGLVSLLE